MFKKRFYLQEENKDAGGDGGGDNKQTADNKQTSQQQDKKDGDFVPRAQYDRAVGDARADAAAERKAAKAAKEEKEAALAAAKTAQEDAEKKIKEESEKAGARIKLYEPRLIEKELKLAAHLAGLNDLDLLALVKRDGIKIDENGEVVGVTEAIAAFKESKPSYFEQKKVVEDDKEKKTGSTKAPPAQKEPPPTDLKKLTPEEYAKRKQEMKAKLRTR